jgi:hypothetical protein
VDPSHIVHLTQYLQALHDAKIETPSHTNLLLNCYSKLKDTEKVKALLNRGGFEIESAIKICRNAGYFDEALVLAKSAKLHDWVITILFEDIQEPSQVLLYISQLSLDAIESAMKRYGGSLIRALPKECTDVLVRLCIELCYPEDFVPYYVDSRTWCMEFLEQVFERRFIVVNPSEDGITREDLSRMAVCDTLFELYLENFSNQKVFIFLTLLKRGYALMKA